MKFHRLRIEKSGIVKGGMVDYYLDPYGYIQYGVEIHYKLLWRTKKFRKAGRVYVGAEALKWDAYGEVGKIRNHGEAALTVLRTEDERIFLRVDHMHSNIFGKCVIHKKDDAVFKIANLSVTGTILKQTLTINAR